jgi:prolyl-tRNA synthetase
MQKVPTPGKSTCEDVAALLNVPLDTTVKSLVLATDRTDAQGAPVQRKSGCCWCAATMT